MKRSAILTPLRSVHPEPRRRAARLTTNPLSSFGIAVCQAAGPSLDEAEQPLQGLDVDLLAGADVLHPPPPQQPATGAGVRLLPPDAEHEGVVACAEWGQSGLSQVTMFTQPPCLPPVQAHPLRPPARRAGRGGTGQRPNKGVPGPGLAPGLAWFAISCWPLLSLPSRPFAPGGYPAVPAASRSAGPSPKSTCRRLGQSNPGQPPC